MAETPQNVDIEAQRIEWERFVRSQHARGLCEFSGLAATACVRSICDCFESEENAKAMSRGECNCSTCERHISPVTQGPTIPSATAHDTERHRA